MLKKILFCLILCLTPSVLFGLVFIGNLNTNQFDPDSVNNPFGHYGSEFGQYSIHNKFGRYGNEYSQYSATNPYTLHAPKLYDQNGVYLGKLSANKFDPDSITNEFGRYGNKFGANTVWNRYSTNVIKIYGE